ncbi:hypothetical protein EWB00_002455 [Schistosoma japonicum]|uniref:Uncharacterized protein n=1 Tax=Schistosoma japonicum TaxID=6182 RepID=A0A4Z2DCQ5_SCHJA|nr:hypothetical protein KSF78_0004016 [Schistosoma japonicum]TNN14245.1 hypothetical protein EWB00_002455 [Schistosoma japonicum]
MNKHNNSKFLQNQICLINNIEQYDNEYLNPFNYGNDSRPFCKPSPLERLQKSCNTLLQNVNPLPYHEILNEFSHKLYNEFNYFSNYSSNYTWIKQKRYTKFRQNSFLGSYLFPFSIAHNSLNNSVKQKLMKSRHIHTKALQSKKAYTTLKNNRKNKTLQSKDETGITALNDSLKMDKFTNRSDKLVTQITSESSQVSYDQSTQITCLTQPTERSSFTLNENCTCTICTRIQMFNILLTSWSTMINFIHNLQSNMASNSNEMPTNYITDNSVNNEEDSLKQHDSILNRSDIKNYSSTLTNNNQNETHNSNSDDNDCVVQNVSESYE